MEHAQSTTSSSAVSDDDMHKLPASRDERADGGHGSESLSYTQCARPSAVRVTRGARTFTLLSFFGSRGYPKRKPPEPSEE